MSTPIMLLTGAAGSGKDTVASFLVKNHEAVAIAQADPMKRLAKIIFGFTDDQLWGPSESRNAVDERYVIPEGTQFLDPGPQVVAWTDASMHTWSDHDGLVRGWLADVFPDATGEELSSHLHSLDRWISDLRAVYGNIGSEKKLTPRVVLQTMGTEWGRKIDPTMWSKYALRVAEKLLEGGYTYDRVTGLISEPSNVGAPMVVITDGRFKNELLNVLKIGGVTVKITSPTEDGSAVEKAGVAGHRSEAEQKTIPDHFFSFHFTNDKRLGLEECERLTRQLWLSATYYSIGPDIGSPGYVDPEDEDVVS